MLRNIESGEHSVLIRIWESAVSNTHHFLKEEDFLYYKTRLPLYFQQVTLYGFEQDRVLMGFMGVYETTLEMLFVDNQYRGKGIGKELMTYAIQRLGINKVDVNEQNIQAVGFYQHIGFKIIWKDDCDGDGKAYPILHMQL